MYTRTTIDIAATCVRLAVLATSVALLCSCDHAERCDTARNEPVAPPDTLTLLAWNVENFYDLTDNGTEYPEYAPGACGWDRFTFEVKLHNIATVLASVDADVAVLCEVENANVVERLRGALRERGVCYPFSATGDTPHPTTNLPAVLSKYPIVDPRGIGTVMVEGYWSRNILQTRIALGGDTLTVFANHWPSKHHRESYRVAAARALAQRLRQLPSGTDYVIAGDLNADYGECETLLTAGLDDTRGMSGINHVLATTDSRPNTFVDYVYERELRGRHGMCHYDLWLELPEARRGCRTHRGQWSTPDHLLLPPALYDNTGISYVDNSFDVFTMNDSLLRDGEPYRWLIAYRGTERFHVGRGYSDHLPLMARFTFSPFVFADSAPMPAPQKADRITFESGVEGWLGHTPGVTISRARLAADSGHALHIRGATRTRNATVARVRLPRWLFRRPRPSRVTLRLRGHAACCMRLREQGARRWTYYAPPRFDGSGRASYDSLNVDTWEHVTLHLPRRCRADALELELRAQKHSTVAMHIDDITVE